MYTVFYNVLFLWLRAMKHIMRYNLGEPIKNVLFQVSVCIYIYTYKDSDNIISYFDPYTGEPTCFLVFSFDLYEMAVNRRGPPCLKIGLFVFFILV